MWFMLSDGKNLLNLVLTQVVGLLADKKELFFDTSASVSCTPFRSDFVWIEKNVKDHSLISLTEQTLVDGVGEVEWKFVLKRELQE
jgi:hypothetical protein